MSTQIQSIAQAQAAHAAALAQVETLFVALERAEDEVASAQAEVAKTAALVAELQSAKIAEEAALGGAAICAVLAGMAYFVCREEGVSPKVLAPLALLTVVASRRAINTNKLNVLTAKPHPIYPPQDFDSDDEDACGDGCLCESQVAPYDPYNPYDDDYRSVDDYPF
jgi:hypothetical protein